MTIKISHLPDHLNVDEQIELVGKSSDTFEAFVKVAKENRDFLFEWLPWAQNTPDESSVEHYRAAPEKKANNESADWDIYLNGEMVGAIGVMQRDPSREVLEIGYWLAEKHNGKGIVSKCTRHLVEMVFEQTQTPLVEIGADINNEKSKAVPLRCGFVFDREFSEHPKLEHIKHGVYYSITREQYESHGG